MIRPRPHLHPFPEPDTRMSLRLLHTSDWHLGQHFMGKSRQAEHQAFCAWLLEQVRLHRVDVVLIAGDIFDTGAPPSHAREQYNRFVVALRDTGARLVVLGGNHDSVAMLGESRELLACLDTWVVPAAMENPADQVLLLPNRDGEPGALLCAIPFLRARDLLRSEAGQSAEDKQRSLQDAIAAHYRRCHEQAVALHTTRFWLARARWQTDGDRRTAWETAQAARDGLRGLPGEHGELVEEIDAWLEEHPLRKRSAAGRR